MCAQTTISRNKKIRTPILYAIAILLGIFSGMSDIGLLHNTGLLISDIFIKIFKCISLPIIALSIIVVLSQHSAKGGMHRIWQRTLFYTIGTTVVAAAVACVIYLLISPPNVNMTALGQVQPADTSTIAHNGYLAYLSSVVPSNIFLPFVEHRVISVLLISVVLGIAIHYIHDTASRNTIESFFKGAHGLFLTITTWVVAIVPIALFGFVTTAIVELKSGANFAGIGEYLLVIVLANLTQGLIILPLWLKMHGIKPIATMRGMSPALSIAFFSKSSAGTLPITIENAERNLKVHPKVSRFVLPLCTTINMNGCAAFIFTTVIYLMQNNGVDITLATMLVWIGIATIAAVGNAGVPMGCFFLSASLLAGMDVPIVLLGIILPFYAVIDMIETSLNVWSDACVAKVVDKKMAFPPEPTVT
ncbi:MAG: Sodium:dicarboxylate symporter [Gammaproteobacteria bacterium]|jgi:Na+/H+-dicarboxylate symporter|nr:Sodium:dicarboxylate symporter [Gammaproteobacteria bacterium]